MSLLHGFGLGIVSENAQGAVLDTFYPQPVAHVSDDLSSVLSGVSGRLDAAQLAALSKALEAAGDSAGAGLATQLAAAEGKVVATSLAENAPPSSVEEAYLKPHLISHRKVKPHETDRPDYSVCCPMWRGQTKGRSTLKSSSNASWTRDLKGSVLEVSSVDKFPKMTNYVVPAGGVRIAHTARVRLGAYLGEGTTVMHEGFINFNAGTAGPGMIEGRISAGVWVGEGSDLGGGCSPWAPLGRWGCCDLGGQRVLDRRERRLWDPAGDRCTIEAGLFVTAGTKISVLDEGGDTIETVSARTLAGRSDLLFRRHSSTGAVQCLTNKNAIELNEVLHANN